MQAGKSNGRTAYNELVNFFEKTSNATVQIEILPPGFPTPSEDDLLCDGESVGIPKRYLVSAFVFARSSFFQNLPLLAESEAAQDEILRATRVMLLWHPEHFTAINARKKILLARKNMGEQELKKLTKSEMCCLDSFVTSPLKRHTKSPVLWQHRRWLLEEFREYFDVAYPYFTGSMASNYGQMRCFMQTLEVVCVAGELHPHNYYAWQFARWHFMAVLRSASKETIREDRTRSPSEASTFVSDLFVEALSIVQNWCNMHPADASGWSYLWFLLRERTSVDSETGTRETQTEVLNTALGNALRWNQASESIWTLIRNILSSPECVTAECIESTMEQLRTFITNPITSVKMQRSLRSMLQWLCDFAQNSSVRSEAKSLVGIIGTWSTPAGP
jgi:protein prenyltransferase alpha subunit repeat containing protein 1